MHVYSQPLKHRQMVECMFEVMKTQLISVFWFEQASTETACMQFYLPADTPPALQQLREQELQGLRNDDGQERRPWDRIYNYAVSDSSDSVLSPPGCMGAVSASLVLQP